MIIYIKLFLTFFKIGIFNFGGGYAMISFIENEIVTKNSWLTVSEFTDIVAVSQMTPGPLGINMATYTGYVVTGETLGAFIATLALCMPSFILMLLISKYLLKYKESKAVKDVFTGIRPAVVGLIASAAIILCNSENFTDYKSVIIFAAAFIASLKFKMNPINIIVISGIVGLFVA